MNSTIKQRHKQEKPRSQLRGFFVSNGIVRNINEGSYKLLLIRTNQTYIQYNKLLVYAGGGNLFMNF